MKKQILGRRRRRRGFTLMEVLLVLVILVILGGMASVFIRGAQQNARLDAARSQLGLFESAIKMFELNNTRYPYSNEGLQALALRSNTWTKTFRWILGAMNTNTSRTATTTAFGH
ncbi:MAG: type II secretion system protein GspG [Pirellulaceae bacterium]